MARPDRAPCLVPDVRLNPENVLRSPMPIRVAVALLLVAGAAAAQDKPSFAQVSAATRSVAEPYFDAYIARDWSRLEPLLADEAHFVDPTAQPVFGPVNVAGKRAVMTNFRQNYAAISHMEFRKTRAFHSGEYAVFEGSLDWSLALGNGRTAVTKNMPFITVLRVIDGQVISHQDLADYSPFLAAVRRAKADRKDE